MEGIATARGIGLEVGRRIEPRQKQPGAPRIEWVEAESVGRPAPERPLTRKHGLDGAHGGAGEHEQELRAAWEVVPDGLDDAGEAWRGPREVWDLVQDDDEGLCPGERGEEPEGGLPVGKGPAGEVGLAIPEIAPHGLRQSCQLDRLGLLGDAEEDGALAPDEVGK